ncbi:MAG: tetratricopeptide repeat protein [Deltaproteobacteria bacterium]|nr:tetratricopeptide repeat protein [Deltaproteobacteria bacterium]
MESTSETVELYFNLGNTLMDQGDFEQAISCYQRVTALNPADYKACYNMGAAFHQLGRLKPALACFQKVIILDPDFVQAYHNSGIISQQLGNITRAIEYYKKALHLDPNRVESNYNMGNALQELGALQEAVFYYQKAITLKPDYVEACYDAGNVFLAQRKFNESISCFLKALKLRPDLAEPYNNMGKAYIGQKKINSAISCFQKAIQLRHDFAEAYYNLGDVMQAQDNPDAAIKYYEQAVRFRPNFLEAYNNLGNALRSKGSLEEAVQNYKQVVRIKPDLAEGYYNLGSTLRLQEEYERAIENLAIAIKLKPDYAEAYNNLALTLKNQGDIDGAIKNFTLAISFKPGLAVAHWNRSFTYLLNEDFKRGFEDYEWRFKTDKWKTIYPYRYDVSRWDGTAALDKTILIHDEQGLGDTIQFVRYIPMVKSMCGTVILETRKSLINLLQGFPGIDKLVERSSDGKPPVVFDLYVPLLTLPLIFKTKLKTIPANVPYLHADPKKAGCRRNRLGTGYKVGIVWAGRPQHLNDRNRSCTLKQFLPLAEIPGIRLYGLQKGELKGKSEEISQRAGLINLGDRFEDFSDTAGAIENLDLVISVDTSVAHLAGAMGKPIWVLLPFIPDWRWMMGRKDSPWYPTMRLFRQERPGDWDSVFRRVTEELRVKVSSLEYPAPASRSFPM